MPLKRIARRKSREIRCRPLPRVQIDAPLDELGFTGSERDTLRRAWKFIRRNFRTHCNRITCEFFLKNEDLLNRFRDEKGYFKLHALYRHSRMVLRVHEILIEHLERPATVTGILKDMDIQHEQTGVTREDFALFSEAVKEYHLELLAHHSTPTLVNALNKLSYVISNVRA